MAMGVTLIVAIVAAIGWSMIGFAGSPFQSVDSSNVVNGGLEDVQVFEELVRREDRVVFDALVTGDTSSLPTVFYNDPTVPVSIDWKAALERAGDEVPHTLEGTATGPIGGADGLLSAQIANIVVVWQNIRAWEEIEQRAAAEGRQPTADEVASMPYGENPYPRKSPEDWVEFPHYLFDVTIGGDHATATRAFIDPKDVTGDWLAQYPGYLVDYVFTRVDGQWYISGETRVYWPFNDRISPASETP
jgi:hypothetical protein